MVSKLAKPAGVVWYLLTTFTIKPDCLASVAYVASFETRIITSLFMIHILDLLFWKVLKPQAGLDLPKSHRLQDQPPDSYVQAFTNMLGLVLRWNIPHVVYQYIFLIGGEHHLLL